MSKIRPILAGLVIVAVLALVVGLFVAGEGRQAVPSAISESAQRFVAVTSDSRMIVGDLDSPSLKSVSEPYAEVGFATSIAYDPESARVFVAAERSAQQEEACLISQTTHSRNGEFDFECVLPARPREDSAESTSRFGAFRLTASSSRNELYVGLAGAEDSRTLTSVIDPKNGSVLRELESVIDHRSLFSIDGERYAEIWPEGENGARSWSGGIVVRSLQDGSIIERRSIEIGNSLAPPWPVERTVFAYFPTNSALEIHDFESGQKLAEKDIVLGHGLNPNRDAIAFDDSERFLLVAVTATNGEHGIAVFRVSDLSLEEMLQTPSPVVGIQFVSNLD